MRVTPNQGVRSRALLKPFICILHDKCMTNPLKTNIRLTSNLFKYKLRFFFNPYFLVRNTVLPLTRFLLKVVLSRNQPFKRQLNVYYRNRKLQVGQIGNEIFIGAKQCRVGLGVVNDCLKGAHDPVSNVAYSIHLHLIATLLLNTVWN